MGAPQLLSDGEARVAEGEVEVVGALLRADHDRLLLLGAVQDDVLLPVLEVPPGYVGAHPELAGDVRLHLPAEHVPGLHGALVEGHGGVRDQGVVVDLAHDPGALAGGAGALGVEGERLGARRVHVRSALRTGIGLLGGNEQRGRDAVPVRAEVEGKARVHQAQHVQQLGGGAEGGADARHPRPLAQRERGGDVHDLVDVRARGLRHATAGVGRQRLDVAAGALGVDHAHGEGGLAGAGDAGDRDQTVQRDVDVEATEVVHARPAHCDVVGSLRLRCAHDPTVVTCCVDDDRAGR